LFILGQFLQAKQKSVQPRKFFDKIFSIYFYFSIKKEHTTLLSVHDVNIETKNSAKLLQLTKREQLYKSNLFRTNFFLIKLKKVCNLM